MQVTPFQQVLERIQPGLTLYGVLLTFFVISFAIGKHFWDYEKDLITEHSDRVKDLLAGFRLRYIEPKINNTMNSAIDGAYEVAIEGLISDLYKTVPVGNEFRKELKGDAEIKDLVDEASLQERLTQLKKRRAEAMFLSSDSGQKMLNDLDLMYGQKSDLAGHYSEAKIACGRTSYAWFALSLIIVMGILRVLGEWPVALIFVWLVLAVQVAVYAMYCFVKLEFHRRKLLRAWEEFEFYGKI